MKQRYNELSIVLCERAAEECLQHKWWRNDVLTYVEKYTGICRQELYREWLNNETDARHEAIRSLAPVLMDMVEDIERGSCPEDIEPVKVRQQLDDMTGKIRDIAMLCIPHQLLGHVAKLLIEPLLSARIEPTQHASIPGRGQTSLKNQTGRLLRRHPEVKYVVKTDVRSAYRSMTYARCIDIVRSEIPGARTAISLLEYLGSIAPDGHLIIGGYIDAWLFNLAMSYAVRHLYTIGKTRRGRFIPAVTRCITYMDDFAIYGTSVRGIRKAVSSLQIWMMAELGLEIRTTTGIIRILSIDSERHRRTQRNCITPAIDMAGYRISRSCVTIRKRVFRRMRRQYLRAWREYQTDGRLRAFRARRIISYNGCIRQTNSHRIIISYHLTELMAIARRTAGDDARRSYRHKRRRLQYVI